MKVKLTKAQINYLIALINQKLEESHKDASILQNLRAKLLEFGESNITVEEEDQDMVQVLRHILMVNIHVHPVDIE